MPDQCVTVEATINLRTLIHTTGIIHPTEQYSDDNQRVVASSLSTTSNSKIEVRVTNTSPNPFTHSTIAEFSILSPQEATQLQSFNSATLKVLADENTDQALEYVNEILKSSEKPQTPPKCLVPHAR